MKLLNSQEFDNLELKGRGRSSQIFNSLINLKIGEGLLIEKKDWKRKAGPSSLVKYIEKQHNLKFKCGVLSNGQGWAIKRIEALNQAETAKKETSAKPKPEKPFLAEDHTKLKSEIVIFYLGRITSYKIEKIEDSMRAIMDQFWEEDRSLLKRLFLEIIEVLATQNHIIIENEKTYIPLKQN
jgi:hypothetical protein